MVLGSAQWGMQGREKEGALKPVWLGDDESCLLLGQVCGQAATSEAVSATDGAQALCL